MPAALAGGGAQALVSRLRGPLRAAVHRDHRARVRAARQRALRNAAAQHGRRRAGRGADRPPLPRGAARRACARLASASRSRCWRSVLDDPNAAAAPLERMLERERAHRLVAIRAGLLCAVIDARGRDPIALARTVRAELAERFGDARAAASRAAPAHALRLAFHEARCALEAVRLRERVRRPRSQPTPTSAPSSCCSRCRTTTR